jgi:hypothetical protein
MRGNTRNKGVLGKTVPILVFILMLTSVFAQAIAASTPLWESQIKSVTETDVDDLIGANEPENQFQYTDSAIRIKLKASTFDPLIGDAKLSSNLAYSQDTGYYMVQFSGPIIYQWVERIVEIGAVILGYIPDNTYVIYLEPKSKGDLESLPFVRWIGLFQPGYKFQGGLLEMKGEVELKVVVFKDKFENLNIVSEKLKQIGGTITSNGLENYIIRARIDAKWIKNVVFIPQVEWIDLYQPPRQSMNVIRGYTGATAVHVGGFDGTGIVGEVKDSGIDLAHPDFAGQILATDGTIIDHPHGTPVFGIVFSSGANDNDAKGMLPGAQGVFCSWGVDPLPSMSNLVNNWGGVFQSNSWSTGPDDSIYNSSSYEHDQGVFTYDITVLHSAGNSGVNPQTCTQESVAKNVIAVAGIRHFETLSRSDDQWIDNGPGSTSAEGPAADGRFKPDLTGPFDFIYTTDSVDGDGENGYAVGDYTSTFSGTSGATPVVAGAVGLAYEMYKANHFGNNPSNELPHASTIKALLIADAYQYDLSTQANRYQQGWGSVDIDNVYSIGDEHFIVNEPESLETGESQFYYVTPSGSGPLKISLVWTDVPASPFANPALVNDLDLKVTDPIGNIYWGNNGLVSSHYSSSGGSKDSINNVENVFIQNPISGTWSFEVIGANVPFDGDDSTPYLDQTYSLVAANAIGRLAINITDPAKDSWVKNITTISGISRGFATQIQVKIDSGSWEIASGTVNWDYDWNTELFSDGQHTIYARAYNGTEYSDVESIKLYVDNTPPSTNLVVGNPNHDNGTTWFVSTLTQFTLVANDGGGSGVDTKWYRILYEATQVQPWVSGTSFTLFWGEGNYVIQYYSKDDLGNTEAFNTSYAYVDMTPPVTDLSIDLPKYRGDIADYWNVSIFTMFSLSPVLDDTGIAFKWYKIDGQYFEGESFDLLGYNEDWHVIEWGSLDLLGNNETGNSETVFLDRTSPTADIIIGTPQFRQYPFNWLNVTNETSFTINAADTISGLAFIWFKIDNDFFIGSNFDLNGYENGTYAISYGAQDRVGNNNSKGPFTINLDLMPPETLIQIGNPSYRDSDFDVWNVTKTTRFDLFPIDEHSGVFLTWYRIDGVYYESPYTEHIEFNLATVINDGYHTISWGSSDNLSYSESAQSIFVNVDTDSPQTNINPGEPKYRDNEGDIWNVTENTPFTLFSNDTGSGVNLTWYTINGNYFEGSVFNLSGYDQGYHTITWGGLDNLGNLESGNIMTVFLSKSTPDTSIQIQGDLYRAFLEDQFNITINTTFHLISSDIPQGVSHIWYTVDDNYFEGTEFDLSDFEEGPHTVIWGGVDNFGKNESGKSTMVFLDKSPPTAVLNINEPKYRNLASDNWYVSSNTQFEIISSDNYSGVDLNWYIIDGLYKKGSTFDLSGYSEGTHTISWGSEDNLGHSQAGKTETVDLDFSPPTITIQIGESSITIHDTVYVTSATEISFLYSDSGVNQTTVYYSIDGTIFNVYDAPFTVSLGTTAIVFQGEDVLGNQADETIFDLVVDDSDTDSDGTYDLEDDDDDNDGLLDILEDKNQNGKVDLGETDSKNPDTDSDGYNDKKDAYPLDKTKFNGVNDSFGIIFLIVFIVVIVLFLLFFLFQRQKGRDKMDMEFGVYNESEQLSSSEHVDFENKAEPVVIPPPPPPQVVIEGEDESSEETPPKIPPPPPPSPPKEEHVEFESHEDEETEFEPDEEQDEIELESDDEDEVEFESDE